MIRLTDRETTRPVYRYEAVRLAVSGLEAAQNRFDNATGDYIDAAALELSAARMRLSAVLREARLFFYPDGLV